MCSFSSVTRLALGAALVLSSGSAWGQHTTGQPITSTPTVPAFQFPAGNPTGFSSNFQNQQFFPAQQFRSGFFTSSGQPSNTSPGQPSNGFGASNNGMNFAGTSNPFGPFGFPFTPFYYNAALYGSGAGYYPVVSSVGGTTNAGWVPTGPNWYTAYRPDIAYTAMLNTIGNPSGSGVSPMAVPSETSGTGSVIIRLPEGAELSVNGQTDKQTGSERRLHSPVLNPGQTHTFHLKLSWYDDGVDRVMARDITVGPGDSKSLMILPGSAKVDPPASR